MPESQKSEKSPVSPTSSSPPRTTINHTKSLFNTIRSTFTTSVSNVTDDPHQILTTSEISRYRDAFERFADEDTETIMLPIMQQIMRRMFQDPTKQEIMEMIREVDDNNDQEVDFDEFLVLIMQNKKRGLVSEDELNEEAFALFDKNHTGTITAQNLQEVFLSLMRDQKDFEPITLEECEHMIKEVKGLDPGNETTRKQMFLSKADFLKLFRMKPGQEPWNQKDREFGL